MKAVPTKSLSEITERLRREMPALKNQYRVRSLSVFGSYARGRQTRRSDVDVLVEFEEPPGLLEFVRLQNHLRDTIGVKVDLVSKGALRGKIGAHILSETVPI
ncbi:MAG TPA: nucleotidyltransferase family protein [Candidatus Latescibacteria bacterium]|nr:nucleotidyltransferase family protein [Candidatus Latescibacterota bacterium]HQE62836.1 nucleotidyltransferase family protein [Candidatus Latescibacterota bacterium]